jgi:RNA polymerase sigma-70 factor (ECF subfamily)
VIDDLQYIKKVTAGERNAFRFLVDKYKDKALAVAYRMVKDQDIAEDVVQDAFVKAYNNLSKFRQDAQFRTWFMRIVVNEAIQIIRHQKVRQKSEPDIKEFIEETEVNATFNELQKLDQQHIIATVFNQLPAREALVLQLFYLDELSLKEMKDVTLMKTNHLKVLLHRARKHFYELLAHSFKYEISQLI